MLPNYLKTKKMNNKIYIDNGWKYGDNEYYKSSCLNIERLLELQETYHLQYKMSEKSIEMAISGDLDKYTSNTIIYYPIEYNQKIIYKLVFEREPVNINNKGLYNHDLLKKYSSEWSNHKDFLESYSKSYYKRYYEKYNLLAPNISIYCNTPIFISDEIRNIHIINLIGLAFDNSNQIDYKCYKKIKSDTDRNYLFFNHMQRCWNYAFNCAYSKKIKNIYFFELGQGFFSNLIDDLNISVDLFKKSFESVKKKYKHINVLNYPVNPNKRVPNLIFEDFTEPELQDVLFVNAWDPHSIVGNGNEGDNSLDGYFGRSTCIGILSWPGCNDSIEFKGCHIK
jgi:hypothetical protein